MDMVELSQKARAGLERVTGLATSSVVGLAPEEDHWVVTLEMVEKRSIPDGMDVLGTYEVKVNAKGDILDFSRTRLRKRGDTGSEM